MPSGTDKISKAKGSQAASIRGKRASSRLRAIQGRAEEGKTHGEERALVRLGTSSTRVLTGQEDLSEWEDEELRRGQRKDRNGRFTGRAPVVVPKALHDELVRRTLSKANETMLTNLGVAVEALVEVIKGKDVEEKDRLRAIGMIMDRVMGKPQERVEITGDTPKWQVAIQAGIVSIDGSMLGGTPEGEVLDVDELDPEDD